MAPCSVGYAWERGHVVGDGALEGSGGGVIVQNCSTCSDWCDNIDSCKSYECSHATGKCNLNDVAVPDAPENNGTMNFCVKVEDCQAGFMKDLYPLTFAECLDSDLLPLNALTSQVYALESEWEHYNNCDFFEQKPEGSICEGDGSWDNEDNCFSHANGIFNGVVYAETDDYADLFQSVCVPDCEQWS
eukprot:UN30533